MAMEKRGVVSDADTPKDGILPKPTGEMLREFKRAAEDFQKSRSATEKTKCCGGSCRTSEK